jgi:hypothetical protein
MKYVLEKESREAERKVIEAQGRAKAIETINEALRQNPNYIRYLTSTSFPTRSASSFRIRTRSWT